MTSAGHIVWAYDHHIVEMWNDGHSVTAIRRDLRDECCIHVGAQAIKDVLATHGITTTDRRTNDDR